EQADRLIKALPGLRLVITVEVLGDRAWPELSPRLDWTDAVSGGAELIFADVAFDRPLWVLWSSGTTGKPKAIVQSHGGIVLGFFASIGLGSDVRPGDRYLIITSASWMMWNYLV